MHRNIVTIVTVKSLIHTTINIINEFVQYLIIGQFRYFLNGSITLTYSLFLFSRNFPIRMWYMEYKDYKYGDDEANDLHEIGHYTQIAWATTHLVGCGVSHCTGGRGPLGKDFFMYVCNYAPR